MKRSNNEDELSIKKRKKRGKKEKRKEGNCIAETRVQLDELKKRRQRIDTNAVSNVR